MTAGGTRARRESLTREHKARRGQAGEPVVLPQDRGQWLIDCRDRAALLRYARPRARRTAWPIRGGPAPSIWRPPTPADMAERVAAWDDGRMRGRTAAVALAIALSCPVPARAAGEIFTVAGARSAAFGGEGVAATAAGAASPLSVAALPRGGFLVARAGRVLEGNAAGTTRTVAATRRVGSAATAARRYGLRSMSRTPRRLPTADSSSPTATTTASGGSHRTARSAP